MTKRIGILTSGGDCAGLNAVIRAIVLHARGRYGWEAVGLREGTQGLLDRPPRAETLGPDDATGLMLRLVGTCPGHTNKGGPFAHPMAPGGARPPGASHSRVMVLEVMGRDAGHIALAAGIAGGADVILIPEIPYRVDAIRTKIEDLKRTGRNFALVVVAEAVMTEEGQHKGVGGAGGGAMRYGGIGAYLAERITQATGAETRVTVLGHVQRGSMPSWIDRILASAFPGPAAVLI